MFNFVIITVTVTGFVKNVLHISSIKEKNKLYQLRLKETLTCDEKKTEAKLLREALFSKFTSIIPTLPVAKAIP